MASNPLFSQLLLVALGFICLVIYVWWPDHPSATSHRPLKPGKLRRTRFKAPKPVRPARWFSITHGSDTDGIDPDEHAIDQR